jgi:hypothetical protein
MGVSADLRIDDTGVSIVVGGKVLADHPWHKGRWSLWIVDAGRVEPFNHGRSRGKEGVPTGYFASIEGRPCFTNSLDATGRDADRESLGLPPTRGRTRSS